MNKTQVLRDIKKRLADFNLDTSVINSTDEAKTRLYLIEPFFESQAAREARWKKQAEERNNA